MSKERERVGPRSCPAKLAIAGQDLHLIAVHPTIAIHTGIHPSDRARCAARAAWMHLPPPTRMHHPGCRGVPRVRARLRHADTFPLPSNRCRLQERQVPSRQDAARSPPRPGRGCPRAGCAADSPPGMPGRQVHLAPRAHAPLGVRDWRPRRDHRYRQVHRVRRSGERTIRSRKIRPFRAHGLLTRR